jgi:uncharacterized membrane protein
MRGYPTRAGEEVKILSRTSLGEKIMKYMKFLGVASAVLMLVIVTLVQASGRKTNSRRCINSWAARTEPCSQAGMIFGQAGDLYRTAGEGGAYGASVEFS